MDMHKKLPTSWWQEWPRVLSLAVMCGMHPTNPFWNVPFTAPAELFYCDTKCIRHFKVNGIHYLHTVTSMTARDWWYIYVINGMAVERASRTQVSRLTVELCKLVAHPYICTHFLVEEFRSTRVPFPIHLSKQNLSQGTPRKQKAGVILYPGKGKGVGYSNSRCGTEAARTLSSGRCPVWCEGLQPEPTWSAGATINPWEVSIAYLSLLRGRHKN